MQSETEVSLKVKRVYFLKHFISLQLCGKKTYVLPQSALTIGLLVDQTDKSSVDSAPRNGGLVCLSSQSRFEIEFCALRS